MQQFLLNLLLAVIWSALMGRFDATTLGAGFGVGYGVLWAVQPALGPSAYVRGIRRALVFAVFYLFELVLSSIRVAIDVSRPHLDVRPAVVAFPLDARTDAEITVLANLISLTPGTLSLDVSPDRRILYVHTMDLENGPETLRTEIRDTLEARVLTLLRGDDELGDPGQRAQPPNVPSEER